MVLKTRMAITIPDSFIHSMMLRAMNRAPIFKSVVLFVPGTDDFDGGRTVVGSEARMLLKSAFIHRFGLGT
jgi:hypothetical protein